MTNKKKTSKHVWKARTSPIKTFQVIMDDRRYKEVLRCLDTAKREKEQPPRDEESLAQEGIPRKKGVWSERKKAQGGGGGGNPKSG